MLIVESYKRTCEACPSQWEGKLTDGQFFYIRFRWGCFGFGLGKTIGEAIRACDTRQISDCLDGFLSNEKMQALMIEEGFDFSHARIDKMEWDFDEDS